MDKNVAKPEGGALRVTGAAGKPAGFEEVDTQRDIIMPRLALLQKTSQMVNDDKGKLGDLANTLTKENFGEAFDFIPLFLFVTRCKFDLETGLVCQSRNSMICSMNMDDEHKVGQDCMTCKDSQWEDEKGPKCSLVYNFPVLNLTRPGDFPISISLMRTSTGAAKQLISLSSFSNEDMFARKYRLATLIKAKGKNEYSVAQVELLGRCSDDEYAGAKKFFMQLRGKAIEVEMEEEAPDFKGEKE